MVILKLDFEKVDPSFILFVCMQKDFDLNGATRISQIFGWATDCWLMAPEKCWCLVE
jgi:hypothetical protein